MRNQITAILAFSLILGLFQNCSDVGFGSPAQSPNSLSGLPDGLTRTESFKAKTLEIITQTDILLIIDESSSMNRILSAMQAGFSALSAANYPSDTKIAVTNMLPAFYTDPLNLVADYTKPFHDPQGLYAFQPGFMRLVNDASIAAFRAADPNNMNFPLNGCADGWFAPLAKNAEGQPCLIAHSQIPLYGIGVEAGITSLDQLVRRQTGPLFRSGSLVNVIFISDTHDAGASYYGRAGAAPARIPFAQLQQNILARNPGLRGLKLNGFVPLPPADHPALQGVRVVGQLPATLDDSKVSGESLWDFSYLPYIAASGGVALHPVGNDWAAVLPQILEESRVLRSPTVTLSRPAQKVFKVLVNGLEIDPSLYSLKSGGRELLIQSQPGWPPQVEVVVEYES